MHSARDIRRGQPKMACPERRDDEAFEYFGGSPEAEHDPVTGYDGTDEETREYGKEEGSA